MDWFLSNNYCQLIVLGINGNVQHLKFVFLMNWFKLSARWRWPAHQIRSFLALDTTFVWCEPWNDFLWFKYSIAQFNVLNLSTCFPWFGVLCSHSVDRPSIPSWTWGLRVGHASTPGQYIASRICPYYLKPLHRDAAYHYHYQ